jgi:hypothetical protein
MYAGICLGFGVDSQNILQVRKRVFCDAMLY